jgi:hypothetical protein
MHHITGQVCNILYAAYTATTYPKTLETNVYVNLLFSSLATILGKLLWIYDVAWGRQHVQGV